MKKTLLTLLIPLAFNANAAYEQAHDPHVVGVVLLRHHGLATGALVPRAFRNFLFLRARGGDALGVSLEPSHVANLRGWASRPRPLPSSCPRNSPPRRG